jgi:urease accessory protein
MLIFDRLGGEPARVVGEVSLAFEWRQKSRLRLTIESGARAGETVGFDLPRGSVLREGALVAAASGESLRVRAADEELIHVEAATPLALARIGYHLGNRHVPLQMGEGWLRLQYDHVLENMVKGLGGSATLVDDAFDPEAGAYGYGHHGHSHGHDHDHDHDHSHASDSHQHDGAQGQAPMVQAPAALVQAGSLGGAHDDRRHAPKIHDFLTDPLQAR